MKKLLFALLLFASAVQGQSPFNLTGTVPLGFNQPMKLRKSTQVQDTLVVNGQVIFPMLQSTSDAVNFLPIGDSAGFLKYLTAWPGGGGGDTISGTAGQNAYFIGTTNITSDANNVWDPVNFIYNVGDLGAIGNSTSFMVDDLNSKIRLNATTGATRSIELNSDVIHLPSATASSFVFTDVSKNLSFLSDPLQIAHGGLGINTATQGDMLYYVSGTGWTRLAKNTSATRYLSNQGTSNAPSWNQVNAANGLTGIVPYANGGTNASTAFTQGSVFVAGATGFVQDNANFFYDVPNHWLGLGTAVPLYRVHVKDANNKGIAIDNAGSGAFQLFVGNGSAGYVSGADYIVSNGTDLYFKTVSAVEQVHMNASGINIFDAAAIGGPILTSGIRTDIHANGGSLGANNALIQLHTDNGANALISLRTTGTNERAGIFVKHSTLDFHLASVFHDIVFDTGLAGDSEAVRITYNGRMGIGTAAPGRTFSTVGQHRYVGIDSLATVDTTNGQFLKINRNGDVYMSTVSGGGGSDPTKQDTLKIAASNYGSGDTYSTTLAGSGSTVDFGGFDGNTLDVRCGKNCSFIFSEANQTISGNFGDNCTVITNANGGRLYTNFNIGTNKSLDFTNTIFDAINYDSQSWHEQSSFYIEIDITGSSSINVPGFIQYVSCMSSNVTVTDILDLSGGLPNAPNILFIQARAPFSIVMSNAGNLNFATPSTGTTIQGNGKDFIQFIKNPRTGTEYLQMSSVQF